MPAELTEHEYDEQGRLVRSVAIREPLWTEQDSAEVLALTEYRAGLCPCCGLPKSLVQGHERDAPRFVVGKRYCWARKTLAETQAQWAKGRDPKPGDGALQWSIRVAKGAGT